MSDLLIFDPYDNLLAVLSNEVEGACSFWDAPFKEILNQGSTFEFTVSADHEDSKHVVAENQVAFMDKDGAFRLFVIKEPEETNGTNGPQITAICEPAFLELNDEIIEDIRLYNTTLQDALSRVLEGTRWEVGEVAELGTNSTNVYYDTATNGIEKCINNWGGEFKDRIELNEDENKISGRFIDAPARRGADTGKRWEIDKDILTLTHKVQSFPKTALYGRGSSLETDDGGFTRKITFADVEWKVSNGDPVDKPLGQEWVGDPEALAEYGRKNEDGSLRHRFGIFDNGDQEDPELLLLETWEALQEQKRPLENYEMDVFLLEEITGYEHEKVRLGDTTFAIDRSFSKPIEIESRVISFEYDVSDPDNTGEVELGQHIDLYADEKRLDDIETKLNDKGGIWDKGGNKPVTDDRIENVTPTKVLNVVASGLFKNILVEWDFVSTISIAHYEIYASQIQGFTPDASNLVYRGKTSVYSHKADNNQQWYFRVRAVNTHGVAGPFSDEATANTARIISEDIFFGEDIAAELRELSKTAQLLAENSITEVQIQDGQISARLMAANSITAANGALANASITRAKLQNAIIGTAQIDDLAVTNAKIGNLAVDDAKIANLSVSKLKAGTIDTTHIKIRGGSTQTYAEIDGNMMGIYGQFVRDFPDGPATYTSFTQSFEGAFRAGIAKKVAGSTTIDDNRWTVLTDKGISTQQEIHSLSPDKNGARFIDLYADETRTGTVKGLGMHIYSGQNMTIEAFYDLNIFADKNTLVDVTSGGFRVNANDAGLVLKRLNPYTTTSGQSITFRASDDTVMGILSQPNNNYNMHLRTVFGDYLILGAKQEIHIKDQDGNGWKDVVANHYKIDSGHSAYINGTGSGNTSGAGDISGTNNNGSPVLMASGIRIRNADFNFYLAVDATGELRVTDLFGAGATEIGYRPIRTSEVRNGSSITYKTNIEPLADIGLSTINNLDVNRYILQTDVDNGIYDNWQVGLISELSPEVATPDGKAINLYKLLGYNVKATQEVDVKAESSLKRLDDHVLLFEVMQQSIDELTQRVTNLEQQAS